MSEEWEKQTILLPLEESEVLERATSMRDVWKRIEICGISEYSSSHLSDMEGVVHVYDEMEDERQMEASSASISCITCLPREILVKILSGLPAKCAVRFSSIGKCPIAVLGFDSISERYKVFASEVFYNGERVFWKQHWVLTLGVDESWREIRSTIFIGLIDAAVHIHGIIYFIPQVTERESSLKMIVAMDVARERIIRFIPFPSGYHQSRQRVREWVPWIKLNGRLAFIDIIIPASEDPHPHPDLAESKIEIWTLKTRSAVEEEWEKQTVLLPLEESKVIGRATSMGFTFNSMGEIVILLPSKTIISPLILIYSFRRDVWRRIEISGVSKYSSSSYISDMEVVVHVDDEIVASF
nr:F-box only protein 8-like [Ipomoea batatas]